MKGFKFDNKWVHEVQTFTSSNIEKLNKSLTNTYPLNYKCTLRVIRDEIISSNVDPIIVSEGANTMDFARLILPSNTPRSRLDAGTN